MAGYVYVFSNRSFKNCLKIGMTERSPYARAKELSNKTAVPTPFTVEFAVECSNPGLLEKAVHKRLRGLRIEKNREFFRVDIYKAVKVIKEGLGELHIAAYSSCGVNKNVYLTEQECAEYQAKRKAYIARVERIDYLFSYYETGITTLDAIMARKSKLFDKIESEMSGFNTNSIHGFFLSILTPFLVARYEDVKAEVLRRLPSIITKTEANIVRNFTIAYDFVEKEGLKEEITKKLHEKFLWHSKFEYGIKYYYNDIIDTLERINYIVSGK